MNNGKDLIWYTCYGSNMLKERFMCYIKGGRPNGASKIYKGCSDTSDPIGSEKTILNHQLYFAKESTSWQGGGVAFIDSKEKADFQTLGRMYLITFQQFIEVYMQENELSVRPQINLNELIIAGSLIVEENIWYNKIIYLGTFNRYPVFTFTCSTYLKNELNNPGKNYLKAVIKGIQETYNLNSRQIENYLYKNNEISRFYHPDDLRKLIVNN